jgi:hypothetical protein
MMDKLVGGISMLNIDAQLDAIQAKRFMKLILAIQHREDEQRHKYFVLPFKWMSAMNILHWECGFSRYRSISNLSRSEFAAYWIGVARCWKKLNPTFDEESGDVLWGDQFELSKFKTKLAAQYLHSVQYYNIVDVVQSCQKWTSMWQLDIPNVDLNWSQVWKSLKYSPITHKHKEIIWLILHNSLTSGEMIQRRWSQYFAPDKFNCKMCNQLESIQHIFLQCPMVLPVVNWFQELINQILRLNFPLPSFSLLSGFLPPSPIINNHKHFFTHSFKILQSTFIFEIWKARCRNIFDSIPFSSTSIINCIKSSIHNRIEEDWLQYRRRHPVNNNNFINTWCLNSAICLVANDSLLISI